MLPIDHGTHNAPWTGRALPQAFKGKVRVLVLETLTLPLERVVLKL